MNPLPDLKRITGLLVESYHTLRSDPSSTGAFYRGSRHGLTTRIRECLAELGVIVTNPPNHPSNIQTQSLPALTLVRGRESACDVNDFAANAGAWDMEDK